MEANLKTRRLTVSAMMIAIATAMSFLCSVIPFLNQLFGGSFTFGSMICIVIVSYMFGVRWGVFTGVVYAVLQMLLGHGTIVALFTPTDDSYMGLGVALLVCLIDYLLAYTVLGLGGIFRHRVKGKGMAMCLGSIVALFARYLCHIVSGALFYGLWAEWFFTQEGIYDLFGEWVLSTFSGASLSIIYSIVYNGMYMIPEIILTAVLAFVLARIPQIRVLPTEAIHEA
ncbi:MAG: energy-coupled thiamine transporter ThiT [Clostridia bacterium]|nr:energy-coupled thiamine transporter ThiT [Clostridia bacterium]